VAEQERGMKPRRMYLVVAVAVALGTLGTVLGAVALSSRPEQARPPVTSQPSSRSVVVPDLAHQSGVAAAHTLREIGFKVQMTGEHTVAWPMNLVIATNPGPGVRLASGSTINLEVSAGP